MTAQTVMLRIAKMCRENIAVFEKWETEPPIKALRWKGALSEARGTVATSKEILSAIRQLRRKARKTK